MTMSAEYRSKSEGRKTPTNDCHRCGQSRSSIVNGLGNPHKNYVAQIGNTPFNFTFVDMPSSSDMPRTNIQHMNSFDSKRQTMCDRRFCSLVFCKWLAYKLALKLATKAVIAFPNYWKSVFGPSVSVKDLFDKADRDKLNAFTRFPEVDLLEIIKTFLLLNSVRIASFFLFETFSSVQFEILSASEAP